MNKQIFKSIWMVAILVFISSLIFIMGISYNYFSAVQKHQLRAETELAAQGVSLSGMDFFRGLDTVNYRITWIDSDGTVLYDSEADTVNMENHLEREEVKAALADGYGESDRYSSTLADKQLYAAKLLPDGTVLPLSMIHLAVWTLILGFAQPICIVALISLALSFFLASRLSKKIVEPINKIDLENPKQYLGHENYKEIEPLLYHIFNQQEQLKRDQEQIKKASLIRQEFTANVSHELRTPLHAISGYAELLEKGLVKSEDVLAFTSKIRSESLRMTRLVEDIIDLTKLDGDGAEIAFEDCDLLRISENALDSLEVAASAAEVNLSVNGVSTIIQGVPQMLYSIIYNLCDNAIKYNRPKGNVKVTVTGGKYFATITVEDNGIGIPEESQNRIFERFYRVDKSRSKEVGGTGLGLSIVKHSILKHHGTIEVTSKEGYGSKFTVTIPNQQNQDNK